MKKQSIFFRADGNSQIGLGHIYRSLALADMLYKDFDCVFVIRQPQASLASMVRQRYKLVELESQTSDLVEAKLLSENVLKANDIVVLDGYHFTTGYQKLIKEKGCKMVCIDDIHACHFLADVIINHAGGLTADLYSKESYTQCYLGLDYALLKGVYLEAARQRKYPNRKQAVFVCLGGADPKNDTLKVLEYCAKRSLLREFYIVVGGSYPHHKRLDEFIETSSLQITKLSNLTPAQMVDSMKLCAVAICSPSTVSYEYLSVGGELYLKVIADNQLNIFNYFTSAGLAFSFEEFPQTDSALRQKVLSNQKSFFRGDSDQNLLKVFKQLSNA